MRCSEAQHAPPAGHCASAAVRRPPGSPLRDDRCIIVSRHNIEGSEAIEDKAAGDQQSSFEAVWYTVRDWPEPQRRSLTSRIVSSLASGEAVPATRPATDLIGAWRDAGPLDDAAVDALLAEELLRKHG